MSRTTTTERVFIVPGEAGGQRLDRFVARVAPELGLRGSRRACEGRVLVNGRPATAVLKVLEGMCVTLLEGPTPEPEGAPTVVHCTDTFAAVFKPCGWHCARLAGGAHSSLEELLERGSLIPRQRGQTPQLLNRLDKETSGLVMIARTAEASQRWHEAEDAGLVDKRYLALCHGLPSASLVLDAPLDTDQRVKTRISRQTHTAVDPLRSTLVEPIALLTPLADPMWGPLADVPPSIPVGLVRCRIRKGARHQIRVHLASAGFPLLGDTLYGSPVPGPFFLHHERLALPDFSAQCSPLWPFFPAIEGLLDMP